MLPRVSAALSSFISPIFSSQPQVRARPDRDFKRHGREAPPEKASKKKEAEPPSPTHENIPTRKEAAPTTEAAGKSGASQTILQLIQFFQRRRAAQSRRAGAQTYQTAVRKQRKTGKFRKGTMVDRKAE